MTETETETETNTERQRERKKERERERERERDGEGERERKREIARKGEREDSGKHCLLLLLFSPGKILSHLSGCLEAVSPAY